VGTKPGGGSGQEITSMKPESTARSSSPLRETTNEDVLASFMSIDRALHVYGVVLLETADGLAVDEPATRKQRGARE
jgi:hypothetical protein